MKARLKTYSASGYAIASLTLVVFLAAGLILSCAPPLISDFSFLGITQTRDDSIAGFQGTLYLDTAEDGLTAVGEESEKQIVIENSGQADIVITDINVFLHSVDAGGNITGAIARQNIFTLRDGTVPDLPLTLSPGNSLQSLYALFKPDTCGLRTGSLIIETNQGSKTLCIAGKGCWNLTLKTNSVDGKIIAPVTASTGNVIYRSFDAVVTLEAETAHPLGLRELDEWFLDTAGTATIENTEALTTDVTLSDHTTITANFYDPYIYVYALAPGGGTGSQALPYQTMEQALTVYDPSANVKKGIVVAAGTYAPASNLTLKKGIFRGGYDTAFSARAYQSETERTNSTYAAIINLGAFSIIAGSTLDETSLFEGFTLNGGTANQSVAIQDGSELAIRYNTINAPSDKYAIFSEDSSPVIDNNVINGSSATDDDESAIALHFDNSDGAIADNVITAGPGSLRSIPVHAFNYSSPTITDNTMTAGNTSSAGGESCGIYVDFFSHPVIAGNTITAGKSTGGGGKSAGIFFINSSSPTINENVIDGGTGGAEAYVLYGGGYGGWPVIENNILFTSGGTNRYGMYLGPNGRIETFSGNNLYDVSSGFVKLYSFLGTEILTTIDQVNIRYVPEGSPVEYLNRSEP